MVLVQVHKSVLRVNQSKVRRDHDPWHDVAISRQVTIVPAVTSMKSVTIFLKIDSLCSCMLAGVSILEEQFNMK